MERSEGGEHGHWFWLCSHGYKFRAKIPIGESDQSSVIKCMLQSPFREGQTKCIVLGEMSAPVVEAVAKYLTGQLECDVLDSLAMELLFAADYLDLPNLANEACIAVARQVERFESFGFLPAKFVEAVVQSISADGLLHAEGMSSCHLSSQHLTKLVKARWVGDELPRSEAVASVLEKCIAKFSGCETSRLMQKFRSYGNEVSRLTVKSTVLCENPALFESLLDLVPNLLELDLQGNSLSGSSVLKLFKAIKTRSKYSKPGRRGLSLDLHNTGLCDVNVKSLIAMIQRRSVSQGVREEISRGSRQWLRKLSLRDNPLGESGVQVLADFIVTSDAEICSLDLSNNNKFGQEGLQTFLSCLVAGRNGLEELNVSSTNCDVSRVLESLFLSDSGPSRHATHRKLKASRGIITQPPPPVRKGVTKLDLSNNFCSLSPSVLRLMSESNSVQCLKSLSLSGNKFDKDAALQLALGLEAQNNFGNLEELFIANVGLCVDGARAISAALSNCSKLKNLDVSRNKLPAKGTAFFAVLVSKSFSLRGLDVSGNDFDVLVAGAFGAAIAKNPSTLHSLKMHVTSLQQHRMRAQGCGALCRGFLTVTKVSLGLVLLDLSGQNITCKGCEVLSSAISRPTFQSIKQLILKSNSIKDSGAKELVRTAISKYESDQCKGRFHLDLSGNTISPEVAVDLCYNSRNKLILLVNTRKELIGEG